MGRWTDDGEGTVFLSPEKNIVLQSRSVAGHFTDNHNADCDTYEQRIAELEAEIARIKAESLRVVRVKSENEINFGAFVRHIFLDGKFVRLERWEEQG